MRTTLTLEPDVARRVESELRRTGKTLKAVINDALKVGLGLSDQLDQLSPFKVEAFAMGLKPGIDRDRMNQLVDELEVEEFVRKYRRDNP